MTGSIIVLWMCMLLTTCQLHASHRLACPAPLPIPGKSRSHERFIPISKAKQVESEVWLLCLGSPGVHQLNMLPGWVTGIPLNFRYHPFHYIDHKEQALIKKRPAQQSAVRTLECKRRFYMDFWIHAFFYFRLCPS